MAERSNFAQTCNLLSQYLKEKRSQYLQGDSFGMKPAPPPATMNLLNTMEASSRPAAQAADQQPRSAAPMTIFYNGQVLVFNNLSAEKAKEIIGLATKGTSVVSSTTESNVALVKPQQQQQQQPQALGSDLPIARRASLHKFLAKRKERVTAIAPYQPTHHNQRAASPKQDERVQSSKHLELSL